MELIDIIGYLIVYSFLGWCCECIYCSIGQGEWVNRGFLNGPLCPIYGFGAVATLLGLQYVPDGVTGVFLGGAIIASTLEYMTSWGMEKLFHAKWWDYSAHKYNINGRVCLLNSTLFGLLCVFLNYDLHPRIEHMAASFTMDFKLGVLVGLGVCLAMDFVVSVRSALDIKLRLKVLGEIKEELKARYLEVEEKLELAQIEEKLRSLNMRDELVERLRRSREIGFFERRLIRAFPDMKSKRHPESLEELKKWLKEKRRK